MNRKRDLKRKELTKLTGTSEKTFIKRLFEKRDEHELYSFSDSHIVMMTRVDKINFMFRIMTWEGRKTIYKNIDICNYIKI